MKTLLAALTVSMCATVSAQQFSSVPGQGVQWSSQNWALWRLRSFWQRRRALTS